MIWKTLLISLIFAQGLSAATLSDGDFYKAFMEARDNVLEMGTIQTTEKKVYYIDNVQPTQSKPAAGAKMSNKDFAANLMGRKADASAKPEAGRFDLVLRTAVGYGGEWAGGEVLTMPAAVVNNGQGFEFVLQGPALEGFPLEEVLNSVKKEVKEIKSYDDVAVTFGVNGANLEIKAQGSYASDGDTKWLRKRLINLFRQSVFLTSGARKAARMGAAKAAVNGPGKAGASAEGPLELPLSMQGTHSVFPNWQRYEKSQAPSTPGWWAWNEGDRGYTIGGHGTDFHFRLTMETKVKNLEKLKKWLAENPGPAGMATSITEGRDKLFILTQYDLKPGVTGADLKAAYDVWHEYSIKAFKKAP